MIRIKWCMLVVATIGVFIASGEPARATLVSLDLTSGTFTNERAPTQSPDTYTEAGFKLQADPANNHIDPGFLGDIGFHNGPANPTTDNDLLLTYSGGAFDFVGINIGGFVSFNGAPSLELTGSNGITVTLSSTGFQAISALNNVTSVRFSLPLSGTNIESAGLNGFSVNTTPTVSSIPEPTTALFGVTLLGACGLARRRASSTAA